MNFNVVVGEDLKKACADLASCEVVAGQKVGKKLIGEITIKDYVSYSFQKLIYAYANELFSLSLAKKLTPINDFGYFKLYLSADYGLGEFKKEILLYRHNGKKKTTKADYWKRWSWSYKELNQKRGKKILEALSDFGIKKFGFPFEQFYLGTMATMKDYLLHTQFNRCAISNEFMDYGSIDLHHAYLHNTQENRQNFPILIDSVINLFAVIHRKHMSEGTWRPSNLSFQELIKLEKFLKENAVERNFVIEPYNAEYFRAVYDQYNAGKLDNLFKKAIKGKVFYL